MLCALLLLAAVATPDRAVPADARAEGEPSRREMVLTPTGEAYLDALGRRGIEARVGYWDPDAAAPPLELDPDLLDEAEDQDAEGPGTLTGVVAAAILLGALAAIVLLAGPRRVALNTTGSAARPARAASRAAAPAETVPPSIAAAEAEPDRRRATALLAEAALAAAAAANGQRLGRAMTMRDALRRIPDGWPGRERLETLARAAEIAHFGGRPVSEAEFARHRETAARLLGGGGGQGPEAAA